ncbi:MAG TPA: TonB family protein [Allosphingosinicella sp.]|jgi:TonB family protein
MRRRPATASAPALAAVLRSAAAIALAAAAAPASSSTPLTLNPEPGSAVPKGPLTAYVTEGDYPAAAIRHRQQGTVFFRLSIGRDGRVTGCTVTSSSSSDLLDSTTCRLMVRRVRFTPATDPQGRPRADEFAGQIEWRLPEPRLPWVPLPERPQVALDLWSSCNWGEASRLALSSLEPPAVAERAIRACVGLEADAARALEASADTRATGRRIIKARKGDFLIMLTPHLERVRRVMGGGPR